MALTHIVTSLIPTVYAILYTIVYTHVTNYIGTHAMASYPQRWCLPIVDSIIKLDITARYNIALPKHTYTWSQVAALLL